MTAALSAASEVLETVRVIDAVLMTSRCASSTGEGPCSGASVGAPAPSFRLVAAGALSWDGPAQAVITPNAAIPAIAHDSRLRLTLFMSATLPSAASYDHFRSYRAPSKPTSLHRAM